MIRIIKSHNRLNGTIFSIAEFGLIAFVIAPFAIYYITHHKIILAAISSGITLNCLPVMFYGICTLIENKTSGDRIAPFWNKQTQEQHKQENPHMLQDTLVLTGSILLPFVCIIVVLYELLKSGRT